MNINRTHLFQSLVVAILLILIIVIGSRYTSIKLVDYSVYWSTGKLMLEGGNPYDPQQAFTKEQMLGFTDAKAQMLLFWYPPWSLPVGILAGLFSFNTGQFLWLITSIGIFIYCATSLWRLYHGDQKSRWLAWLLAFLFTPTLFALIFGQVSPLMLLGVTGFLLLIEGGSPRDELLAGLCLGLAAIKPNALYLIWPALLLWSISQRRYRALAGLALAISAGTIIAVVFRPTIIADYLQFIQVAEVTSWKVPTIGFWLRSVISQQLYLQFAPFLIGLIWLGVHWTINRKKWSWRVQISWLTFVSLITTAFVWTHDQVLLLPALMEAAILLRARLQSTPARVLVLAVWLVFNVAIFVLHLSHDDSWFVWQAPVMLLAYMVIKRFGSSPVSVKNYAYA